MLCRMRPLPGQCSNLVVDHVNVFINTLQSRPVPVTVDSCAPLGESDFLCMSSLFDISIPHVELNASMVWFIGGYMPLILDGV